MSIEQAKELKEGQMIKYRDFDGEVKTTEFWYQGTLGEEGYHNYLVCENYTLVFLEDVIGLV